MRISPYGVSNGMSPDANMDTVYERLVAGLNDIGLVYIRVVDHGSMGAPVGDPALKAKLRAATSPDTVVSLTGVSGVLSTMKGAQ
jgi:hypothetical protein